MRVPGKLNGVKRFLAIGAAVGIIFVIALSVRLLYQSESNVYKPIRADAAKYITVAYNLRHFGVYSLDTPRPDRRPPTSNTDLSPVYPIFLIPFIGETRINDKEVLRVQAVMGAMACVVTFLLALLALKLPWAFAAGLLTALSPHLIALDNYLLTESLFTFVMMLGLLFLALAWRTGWLTLTLLAGLLLALSAHVRAVNMLLVLWMVPLFFFMTRERLFAPRKLWLKQISFLILGLFIITASHYVFVNQTKVPTMQSVVATDASEKKVGAAAQPKPQKKNTDIVAQIGQVKRTFVPPEFYAEGTSHVQNTHSKETYKSYKQPMSSSFWEDPIPYLKWNLWGRLGLMWHWDNAYNGDVYIYPMNLKGFEENDFLKYVHRVMRAIHWPLVVLSLLAPLVLLVKWRRQTLSLQHRVLLVTALAFVYLVGVYWTQHWLPRYTIPIRPLCYILAMASLCWLFEAVLRRKRTA